MTWKYFNRQHLIFFIQVYPLSFIPMRRNCRRPCPLYLENPFLYIARLWLQLPRVNSLYRFKSALYIHTSIIQIRELCPLCGCYEIVLTRIFSSLIKPRVWTSCRYGASHTCSFRRLPAWKNSWKRVWKCSFLRSAFLGTSFQLNC